MRNNLEDSCLFTEDNQKRFGLRCDERGNGKYCIGGEL